jgi:XTP/dITP diphosphohydrolase
VGTRGFGYDRVFVPHELGGRTFGEVTALEKARVSHRARAFAVLAHDLRDVYPNG